MPGWRAEEIARRKAAAKAQAPKRTSFSYRPGDTDAITQYIDERADWEMQEWEYRFIDGFLHDDTTVGGLSLGRGGGKTALVEGIAAACIDPDGPLHQGHKSQVFVSTPSKDQARGLLEGVARMLGLPRKRGNRTPINGFMVQRSEGSLLIEHECGSALYVLGSVTKAAHGRRPQLHILDEPAQMAQAASRIWAAATTGLGKVPGSKALAIGTRSDNPEHWFEKVLNDTDPATYTQVYKADKRDPFGTWQKANPNLHLNLPDRKVIEAELRKAQTDPAARAMFLSLRCNLGLPDWIQDADMVCTVEAWEALGICDNAPGYGPPTVVGIDLGDAVSLSSVVGVWADGTIAVHTFVGGVPNVREREDNDGVTGLYQGAFDRGELTVIEGLRVPPAADVLQWVADNWGSPRKLVADTWRKQNVLDAVDHLGWHQDDVEIRSRAGAPVHDDLERLRSGIALRSFVRPDSLLLDAAMSRACMKTSKWGQHLTPVKPHGLGPRDDPFAALLLAWPTYERLIAYEAGPPAMPELILT